MDNIPDTLREKIFEKMFAVAEVAKLSPDEYQAYIDSLNSYRDLQNSIDTAKAEGKAEEKIETTLKMLGDGMSFENICKYTELSKEQIEQLINDNKK